MEIISGVHNIKPRHRGCVVALGNFDGVHLGHQQILARLCEAAEQRGVPSALVTFEPQPREFFAGAKVPARLTRFREKVVLLKRSQLDRLICLPFNERTANTSAAWIAQEFLHDQLGAEFVLLGDDARFGRGAEGDFAMLSTMGESLGYTVGQMDTYTIDDARVSSSRIREVLAAGQFELAERLLGHEYFIMGRVVYGRQLGRQLGVPTANVRLQRYRAALEGVYAVTVSGIGQEVLTGVANIGVRPTVDGKEPLLETHIFDFRGDIYGQLMSVTFKHKIRDEQAFGSIDELKAQIERDIKTARDWFAAHGTT